MADESIDVNIPDGVVAVPMFATSGWTTSLREKADALMSNFFETDALQSNLYRGSLTSIQYLVQQFGTQPDQLANNVRQALESYLGRHYPQVVVDASTNIRDAGYTDGTTYTLRLRILITEGGVQYSMAYLLNGEKTTIKEILRMNNDGTPA